MPKQKKSKSRRADALRPVRFLRRFTDTPAGSVLVEMGRTKVLCTASLESGLAQVASGFPVRLGDRRVWYAARLDQPAQTT